MVRDDGGRLPDGRDHLGVPHGVLGLPDRPPQRGADAGPGQAREARGGYQHGHDPVGYTERPEGVSAETRKPVRAGLVVPA